MNNKEFAYKLYNMNIGESISTPLPAMFPGMPAMVSGKSYEITCVPGGWIWAGVFVKFDDEFEDFANSPTKEKVRHLCGNCKNTETYDKKESYQKEPYVCPGCGCNI